MLDIDLKHEMNSAKAISCLSDCSFTQTGPFQVSCFHIFCNNVSVLTLTSCSSYDLVVVEVVTRFSLKMALLNLYLCSVGGVNLWLSSSSLQQKKQYLFMLLYLLS